MGTETHPRSHVCCLSYLICVSNIHHVAAITLHDTCGNTEKIQNNIYEKIWTPTTFCLKTLEVISMTTEI